MRFAQIASLIFMATFIAFAQVSTSHPTPTAEAPDHTAQAVRVENGPRMDGTLDDPLWQLANPISGLRQREPYEGMPATEQTVVKMRGQTAYSPIPVLCRNFKTS